MMADEQIGVHSTSSSLNPSRSFGLAVARMQFSGKHGVYSSTFITKRRTQGKTPHVEKFSSPGRAGEDHANPLRHISLIL
ncbi:hypothetical protein BCR34DRAFT_139980 [Clohesyomyces aquaticus]|uniref:Uncharacterized protein n=1 Tax=Clohesyomyces aquaticus TaxID=1231657 RepID=A0A1Y1YMY6_9PLEO|nr:hypothetical protein BCR34DRAFT_139980 [Clohesyomyces aquaticus]